MTPEQRIAQLEAALEALRRTEHCWCDVSIGNPMMRQHSDACRLAQGAAKGIPMVRDTAPDHVRDATKGIRSMGKDDKDARIAALEAERDALAVVIQHLRPHAREMYVCIPKKGTVTLGWLMDQAGYREVVAARDARMKRTGSLEALRGLKANGTAMFDGAGTWAEVVMTDDVDAAIAALEQEGRFRRCAELPLKQARALDAPAGEEGRNGR